MPRLGGLVALLLRAQRLLSLLGYTVRAAGSPESALGLVTSRPSDIHLVITDKVIR